MFGGEREKRIEREISQCGISVSALLVQTERKDSGKRYEGREVNWDLL